MITSARPHLSEACHWYYRDGQPCYDVPNKSKPGETRKATIADARKLDLLPSPTSICKLLHRHALVEWQIEQAILAVLSAPQRDNEPLDDFVQRIIHTERHQDEERDLAAERGREIHRALQLAMTSDVLMLSEYIREPVEFLKKTGRTVATERVVVGDDYAGMLDLLLENEAELWVVDFKGLAVDTPLPTPTGWSTMADIQVGDQVFNSVGKPCNVIAKSSIHARPCFRIHFDDASSIVADNEHLWRVSSSQTGKTSVLNTEELQQNLTRYWKQKHLCIPLSEPLELPEVSLPIPPYTLGCWIGDGTQSTGAISKPDDRMFKRIASDGFEIGGNHAGMDKCPTRTIYGLRTHLRKLGLLRNKHIPAIYLRSSVAQRLALLHGLMDTDGSWNSLRKQAVFSTSCDRLAEQVFELVSSLGHRASKSTFRASLKGRDYGQAFRIVWRPWRSPAFWSKKGVGMIDVGPQAARRLITEVEPIASVPTQCIAVDSEDHMYLCGRQMVPTHNTCKTIPEKQYNENRLQLSGYAGALGNTGDKRIRCANLYISTKEIGQWKIIESENWPNDYKRFQLLVQYHKLTNGL